MEINLKIEKISSKKGTSIFEYPDFRANIDIEYSVPCDNLYFAYPEDCLNPSKEIIRKIDHVIAGTIKYKDIVFTVTLGVIIGTDNLCGKQAGVSYVIISQDSTHGDYWLIESDCLDFGDGIVITDKHRIVEKENHSLLQFYADTCNAILETRDDKFIIGGVDADEYVIKWCYDILQRMGIVSDNIEYQVINQTGQHFLKNGGIITKEDIAVFIRPLE